jgi:hypothetical protein
MTFTKPYNIAGTWILMSLTDKEVEEVEESHRKDCLKKLNECLTDSEIFEGYSASHQLSVALALFDKRSHQLFTMIQAKLDEKIMLEKKKLSS